MAENLESSWSFKEDEKGVLWVLLPFFPIRFGGVGFSGGFGGGEWGMSVCDLVWRFEEVLENGNLGEKIRLGFGR